MLCDYLFNRQGESGCICRLYTIGGYGRELSHGDLSLISNKKKYIVVRLKMCCSQLWAATCYYGTKMRRA